MPHGIIAVMWVRACLSLCFALLALAPIVHSDELPDFMEYWEWGINIDEDQGPLYYTDIILPLYRSPEGDRAVFFEPRVNYADSEYLFNLGWGYRQLVDQNRWMLGGNMFYDYDTEYSHYRLGWGLEALSHYAELRGNYYLGLSQERAVEEFDATKIFEEAVDGFDLELGVPVPYYSRVKVFGGYNWYNFKKFKNRYGWTLRTEYTPLPYVVIDGLVSDNTKGNVDWGMTAAFRIPLGKNLEEPVHSPLLLDDMIFPEGDASDRLWVLVERHHEIVVEVEREVGGISVEITRND